MEKEDEENTKLRQLEIDIKSPLSQIDWKNLCDVVNEVQGLAWLQILPVGQKSSQPFQFNMVHVLPNSKIPFSSLTMDVLISNKTAFLKAQQDSLKEEDKQQVDKRSSKMSEKQKEQNASIITLEEFKFPHAIFLLESTFTENLLM
mmetsp:Transcript_21639/g.20755  ORF Transcript_21639/g.20755 Transcript_21639/m.20755 type:complete len:146 (+) Transcript_21639:882-1319(+)